MMKRLTRRFDTKYDIDMLNEFIHEEPDAHIINVEKNSITVAYTTSCKHLHARITGSERVGHATCPNCGEVYFDEVLNNFLDEMRSVLGVR